MRSAWHAIEAITRYELLSGSIAAARPPDQSECLCRDCILELGSGPLVDESSEPPRPAAPGDEARQEEMPAEGEDGMEDTLQLALRPRPALCQGEPVAVHRIRQ